MDTVLFDFDGTLADTNELISEAHFRVVQEYFPGRFQRDRMHDFNGPPLEEIYGELNHAQKDEMIAKYRVYAQELHDASIQLFPGIKEMLVRVHSAGVKIGIVSTKRKDTLQRYIWHLEIAHYVDAVVGMGDYTHPKPHPEALVVAMERLHSEKAHTLMVGDNYHDIEAGNRAGVQSVFVGWSQKAVETILPYHPNFIVTNVLELEELILGNHILHD